MTNHQITPPPELVDAITAHAYPDKDAVGYVAGLLTRARAALAEPVIPVKQRVFPTPSQAAECGGPCYEENYCPEACDCGLYQRSREPMTDFSPNVEVVLSSDLFEDDPCFEDMSAPALAVLDAYMTGYGWLDGPTKKDCCGVAAALRAAALYCKRDAAILLAIADELEACCEYMQHEDFHGFAKELRAIRRPKAPSLKEEALAAQQRMWDGTSNHDDWNLIRRALEALPND